MLSSGRQRKAIPYLFSCQGLMRPFAHQVHAPLRRYAPVSAILTLRALSNRSLILSNFKGATAARKINLSGSRTGDNLLATPSLHATRYMAGCLVLFLAFSVTVNGSNGL